ncbi:MAG: hypothetical protein QOG18_107 [Microbacteriaceae bacterium]|nr:hypothetical protein [Microbacteriaceae bacterium]
MLSAKLVIVHTVENQKRLSVVVVGGSLVGLAAAIALGRAGHRVKVVERSAELLTEQGSGLGVDLGLLSWLVGERAVSELPAIRSGGRVSASWSGVYQLLRDQAGTTPGVTRHDGVTVQRVSSSGSTARDGAVVVETAGLGSLRADVVVGADGYRSLVRRHVAEDKPESEYAGYWLWRGVLDEADILDDSLLGKRAVARALDRGLGVFTDSGGYLVTYPMPGKSGSIDPGRRRLSWNWYWSASDGEPPWQAGSRPRTILASELDPTAAARVAAAADVLPYPWPRLIELTTQRRGLFTNAIYEYLPHRLVGERAVIIGDAAHVATPMTGAGLITGFEDVIALTEELGAADATAVPDALRRYEQRRLGPARELVGYSMSWSSRFRSGH